ncbi:MAG: TolC family protein [Fibrobacteria bacterium]|nr:TolC family protein [Fibrobacteria bacterium]
MRIASVFWLVPGLAAAQPMTLTQGLEEALTRGPEAALIRISVDSANELVREVRKVAWPSVSGYANTGVGRQPSMLSGLGAGFGALGQSIASLDDRVATLDGSQPGRSLGPLAALQDLQSDPDEPTWSVGYGVQASQALFTFGKVTTALHMASTQKRITSLKVRMDRSKVQGDFLGLWSATALAEQKVGIVERSIARQTEVVAYLERAVAGGLGSRAQLLMARSQLLRLHPDLLAARRDALTSRRMLNRTLGRSADESLELDTAGLPALEALLPPAREELLRLAMDNRSDLKFLDEAKSLQNDIVTIYRANYLPNLGLVGKAGVISANTDMGEAFKEAGNVRDNYEWSVGLALQWNLFDGFEQSAKAGQTRAAVHALEIRREDLRRMVEVEVDKVLMDREAADSALASALQSIAAAAEARTLADVDFRQGSGALSDLLAAEENLRMAELALVAARLERTRSAAALALVRGQDLIALSEEP